MILEVTGGSVLATIASRCVAIVAVEIQTVHFLYIVEIHVTVNNIKILVVAQQRLVK